MTTECDYTDNLTTRGCTHQTRDARNPVHYSVYCTRPWSEAQTLDGTPRKKITKWWQQRKTGKSCRQSEPVPKEERQRQRAHKLKLADDASPAAGHGRFSSQPLLLPPCPVVPGVVLACSAPPVVQRAKSPPGEHGPAVTSRHESDAQGSSRESTTTADTIFCARCMVC
jgi:hypothetical protein